MLFSAEESDDSKEGMIVPPIQTDIKSMQKRLLLSRMRILCDHGFYGLLLMHMKFALDSRLETAATDGTTIWFSPQFLAELADSELDFVMMHEIMHVVLRHCARTGERDNEQFNIACDIVVNSNILLSNNNRIESITLRKYGASMHLTPDGNEGHLYTAEQVYEMLGKQQQASSDGRGKGSSGGKQSAGGNRRTAPRGKSASQAGQTSGGKTGSPSDSNTWDNHSRWSVTDDPAEEALWEKRLKDACEAVRIRDPSNERGLLPLFAQRILEELRRPQTDWRTVLNDFVQEDITDYSFTPPDRRFGESDFFLPDYNEREEIVSNILFMIDTSGSMSDQEVTAAYSEIKGAIDCFNGRLRGWLGFFDGAVIAPKPFEDIGDLLSIHPAGGGGTSFHVIFDYIRKHMADDLPASIIILTDGYAPFPKESAAMGIPVLWLLNNQDVEPPWGRVTRITVSRT